MNRAMLDKLMADYDREIGVEPVTWSINDDGVDEYNYTEDFVLFVIEKMHKEKKA
jgi:hypothetical protein